MKVKVELELELPEGAFEHDAAEVDVKKVVLDIVRNADDTLLKNLSVDVQEVREWQLWRRNQHDFLPGKWLVCDLPNGIGYAPCSAARGSVHYHPHFKDKMTGTLNEALHALKEINDLQIAFSPYAHHLTLRREKYRFYDPMIMSVDIPMEPNVHIDLTEFLLTEFEDGLEQLAAQDFKVDQSDLCAIYGWMKRTRHPSYEAFLTEEREGQVSIIQPRELKLWLETYRSDLFCGEDLDREMHG